MTLEVILKYPPEDKLPQRSFNKKERKSLHLCHLVHAKSVLSVFIMLSIAASTSSVYSKMMMITASF